MPHVSRLYIIDPDREFACLLKALLEESVDRIESFSSAEDFLVNFDPSHEALVLVEAHLPNMSGFKLLELLQTRGHTVRAILMSSFVNASLGASALQVGARDLVTKPFDAHAVMLMLEAVRSVLHPGHLSAEMARSRTSPEGSFAHRMSRLTPRETEVAHLVAEGCSSKVIAQRLGLSKRTIDNHRTHVIQKLGVVNSCELARELTRSGLLHAQGR
jgi:two-component system, LuxR family, response regulator FixJ